MGFIGDLRQALFDHASDNEKRADVDIEARQFAFAALLDNNELYFGSSAAPDNIQTISGHAVVKLYQNILNTEEAPWHEEKMQVRRITAGHAISPLSISGWFEDMENLEAAQLDKIDTSNITDMQSLFANCSSLRDLEASKWNTSNVTDMRSMFHGCKCLQCLDLDQWNTESVTDMSYLFYDCTGLLSIDLKNWDTSRVEFTSYMFYNCEKLTSLDMGKWNTEKVTSMEHMFHYCDSLTAIEVSDWNTSHVQNMFAMFYGCQSLAKADVSKWDTSNLVSTGYMFYKCFSLPSVDISRWDISNIGSTNSLFDTFPSNVRLVLPSEGNGFQNSLKQASDKLISAIESFIQNSAIFIGTCNNAIFLYRQSGGIRPNFTSFLDQVSPCLSIQAINLQTQTETGRRVGFPLPDKYFQYYDHAPRNYTEYANLIGQLTLCEINGGFGIRLDTVDDLLLESSSEALTASLELLKVAIDEDAVDIVNILYDNNPCYLYLLGKACLELRSSIFSIYNANGCIFIPDERLEPGNFQSTTILSDFDPESNAIPEVPIFTMIEFPNEDNTLALGRGRAGTMPGVFYHAKDPALSMCHDKIASAFVQGIRF